MVTSHPLLFIFTMVNPHPHCSNFFFYGELSPIALYFYYGELSPHCSFHGELSPIALYLYYGELSPPLLNFFFIFMVNSHPLLFIFTMVNSHPIALFRGELSPILTVPGEHSPHCLYNTYTFLSLKGEV